MENYEKLLEEAYSKVKSIKKDSERFEIPKVKGSVSGKNTIITNILLIANQIRRPVEHLVKFLQKELAVSGILEKERLILKTRLNSSRVNEKIELYVKEFVLCQECKKPDTEIISEKSIKFKHCLACGAKSPIKNKI
ncbi:translation initiation factor IF-2 subunit beta [Candidatus Parvarchaeota archaeon]|jgi:translation initiation factor 2 subunit 2|nr:MAG: translation initiation factor IF-2 subunit beta [Candidatus Parvarchaeota archaeon]RZD31280.1 MAG: translation initiation factor IF-2 subunit beta [Candidatus Parvarchaeota archaeon]HIG51978.1 translation initiation factor IF-2 subunit beta [Candidatus Pacearchaeota archaeon]